METGWVRKRLSVEGGSLSCLKWELAGEGAPWVVFSHGNGLNARAYTMMLETLSGAVNIVALDARGHGLTELPATQDMLARDGWRVYERDLRAVVRHLGRPLILVGHSLGADVSAQAVSKGLEGISGLFLIDPVVLPPWPNLVWSFMRGMGLGHRFPVAARAARRRREFPSAAAVIESYRGRGIFRTWRCDCLEEYVAGGVRERPDGSVELTCDPAWEAATFTSMSCEMWEAMRKVRVPMTILYGTVSDTFPAASARHVKGTIPSVKLIPVAGASHFVAQEEPVRVGQEILRFVREVRGEECEVRS